MNIDDDMRQAPSITEGDQALKLFTNRVEFVRLFAQALNDEPPGRKIFFFYGDGGNGKSLLLKFLRQQCCKRLLPQTWQPLQRRSDAEIADYIEKLSPTEYIPVLAVLHDFGQNIGIERPQDAFYGLLMLRRNLAEAASGAGHSLQFPLYDFACIWYLHKKGKSPEEIKSLFPVSDAAGLVSTLVDAIRGVPFGSIAKAVLDLLVKDLDQRFTIYLSRVGLSEARIKDIQQKDIDTELIYELPKLLADGVNAAMHQRNAPKRLVLMFDTHEAFWGQQKGLADTLFFERDEWLRRLLRSLDLSNGIVVVVAGREPPRWAEAGAAKPGTEIPKQYLTVKEIRHFTITDAALYLQRVGITDEKLCQALIATASVQPNEVHPLYLGLSADTVLQAKSQGITLTANDFPELPNLSNQAKVLIERLLKYVDREIRYAVHALSACRSFDFDLYLILGEALKFQATRPGFELLTSFSFVWQSDKAGRRSYRIHDLLRRLDDEEAEITTKKAHQVLLEHYHEQKQFAEEIYHLNRLDWEQGIIRWIHSFNDALHYSRYEQCRTLLEVRNVLIIRNAFYLGRISDLEGQYFDNLSQHQEALQEYQESIAAYDEAIKRTPDAIAFSNKGSVLLSLGKLQARLSQYETAMSSYQRAIAVFDEALLRRTSNFIPTLNNKGSVLLSLGKLQVSLSQYEEAISTYRESVTAYEEVLKFAPYYVYAHNNKGNTLAKLGELQAHLSKHEEAMSSYQKSIEAYDEALQTTPDYIEAFINKATTLQSLGELQACLSEYEAANSYQKSITAYNKALQQAPDDIQVLDNKGSALQRLGNLQASLSEYEAAIDSYKESVATYKKALQHAPDDIYTLNNEGLAFARLGELQVKLLENEAAKASWRTALELVSRSLQLAPNDTDMAQLRDQLQQALANCEDA